MAGATRFGVVTRLPTGERIAVPLGRLSVHRANSR
jgi:hypothetical protein